MDKVYQHNSVEKKWQAVWQVQNIGQAKGTGKPYSIVIPPPNVTGTLHMGHGFQLTIMDILIRYHRMSGHKTLWQVGTDHAGIATQMVVERQLAKTNTTKHDLGRTAFLDKVWDWKKHSQTTITKQMQALGTSMDWSRERFTLDKPYTDKVAKVFVDLYKAGLIYRGQRLVNWDPALKTAVSDLEVVNEERSGNLWHIKYELAEQPGVFVEIATTRPETLLGDQAVAVHPDDSRYQHLVGKFLKLPLTKRSIPIIADEYVDPEFGSGCVKITPAHDFNDAEVGKRHHLPNLNILNPDASLNKNVPEAYQGLDRFAARKLIISDLGDLVVKIEQHTHNIPVGDRSGAILEPLLTNQWFLNCDDLADKALEIVRDGTIEFIPKNWFNTYKHWLENIQDWCISRQLWWGHQIPAWYDSEQNIYVGLSEASVRASYQLSDAVQLQQEEDVLDTWFSSALWPFVTLDWQEDEAIFKEFYPTQVLVTGFDIIFFWVARMIMMGLKCTKNIPFKQVYITGLIKDEKGQKMSKSKGNVLDPLDLVNGISLPDLIEKRTGSMMQPKLASAIAKQTKKAFPDGIMPHGTDALRFTFCALASNGRDIRFDLNRLTGYRNFCNKIWNASRLVLSFESSTHNVKLNSEIDNWILNKMQICINDSHKHIKAYRFDLLAKLIYDYVWHDFCDRYLEWAKTDKARANSQAGNVAKIILENIIKLIHPIMPFISEEIWHNIHANSTCLALADYPKAKTPGEYNNAEIENLFALIAGVRNLRSELNISPKIELTLTIEDCSSKELAIIEKYKQHLKQLLRCGFSEEKSATISASIVANSMQFSVPVADLINPKSEITRIEQVLKKQEKLIKQAASRLDNERYCANAPAEQVMEYQLQLKNAEIASKTYNAHLKLMQELLAGSNCE